VNSFIIFTWIQTLCFWSWTTVWAFVYDWWNVYCGISDFIVLNIFLFEIRPIEIQMYTRKGKIRMWERNISWNLMVHCKLAYVTFLSFSSVTVSTFIAHPFPLLGFVLQIGVNCLTWSLPNCLWSRWVKPSGWLKSYCKIEHQYCWFGNPSLQWFILLVVLCPHTISIWVNIFL